MLIRESIANVGVEIAALGICAEEFLVARRRHVEKSVEFAAAELNVEQVSTRIVPC